MAYTIKGLAKANECETKDANGLANLWSYWYVCNCGGRNDILNDFKLLRKADRKEMLSFMKGVHDNVYNFLMCYAWD